MNRLRLEVRVDDVDGVLEPQLVARVDGTVLGLGLPTRADAADSGLGMDPDALLGRRGPLYPLDLGEPDDQHPRATLWRCSCGIVGCSSIGVRVRREHLSGTDHDVVVWDEWRIQYGFAQQLDHTPPPYTFDTAAYFAELIRAGADRWWENAPHRAARELAAALDGNPGLLGRRGIALLYAQGYLHDGAGWLTIALRGATGRHFARLPCDPAADPAAEARRWRDRLADGNLADLPGYSFSSVP